MKQIITTLLILIAAANLTVTSAASKPDSPTLIFDKIIIPEAPPVASVMVAYMNIKNTSNQKQTINQILSPQFERVEIHTMSMKNGMMDMKQMKTLSINPQQTIVLETGGLHVMLIKPRQVLKRGDSVEITFKLSSGEMATISTQISNPDLTDSHQHH